MGNRQFEKIKAIFIHAINRAFRKYTLYMGKSAMVWLYLASKRGKKVSIRTVRSKFV